MHSATTVTAARMGHLVVPALLACYKHSASTATQTTDAAPAGSVATAATNATPTPQPHTPTLNAPQKNNESLEPHALRATVRTRTEDGRSMLLNELSP